MIYRIDVGACPDRRIKDPHAAAVQQQIKELGHDVGRVESWRIFYVESSNLSPQQLDGLCRELLADPIVEHASHVTAPPAMNGASWVEIHLKPGVMDPVAASTEMAIRDMGIDVAQVRTGRAYRFEKSLPAEQLRSIAQRILANEVIESIHTDPVLADQFPSLHQYALKLRHVPIRNLDENALSKLSRDGHLFLSLEEMRAVQNYFRRLEREPTDIELETIAQTWSEHCVHKTLKSAVEVVNESGKTIRTYDNLIKETIFKATAELMRSGTGYQPLSSQQDHRLVAHATSFCLSVFKDNAGVIAFDETDAVCFKVETHNHPSAIEPYGGSATGVGGVIRDILGTGLGARPIANTDVFCVAHPEQKQLPRGVIHPKRILQRVVAGVRDYGNRMGIPTVNGAVYFDDRYIGNPLVFCGCVGVIPRDKIDKQAQHGDAIVLLGGRTGRDGIHGATFSSAELTDTHADEFSHAVQIGNAITEKKLADVVIQARDRGLFTAITDCGAGGLSSAVGEMAADLGAEVELDRVPLKYAGLRYDEIWISEAQERMVMSVPAGKVQELLKLSAGEDVEATVIGRFGVERKELILRYAHTEVGRLSMDFLHDGLPMPKRVARDTGVPPVRATRGGQEAEISGESGRVHGRNAPVTRLLSLLSHPNIASKHWIIRQYDHEVQSGSVIKPLVGPQQRGPSDAAVIRPKLTSFKGVALACGLAPHIDDPYEMAIASIDEAIRNAVAVGGDPAKLAMLDNFCWPSVDDDRTMGALVRACEACYDAAKAFGIPFISGKDSLHNQFTNSETGQVIKIPYTLLISTIGVVDDVRKCVTMDLKSPGNSLYLVRPAKNDLASLPIVHRAVASAIARGLVRSAHDVSDGGPLVAAAEMCIAAAEGIGLALMDTRDRDGDWLFDDRTLASYLLELPKDRFAEAHEAISSTPGVESIALGQVLDQPRLVMSTIREVTMNLSVDELTKTWRGTLDW
jgi:phosphoribosylformylglycinamidine synthase